MSVKYISKNHFSAGETLKSLSFIKLLIEKCSVLNSLHKICCSIVLSWVTIIKRVHTLFTCSHLVLCHWRTRLSKIWLFWPNVLSPFSGFAFSVQSTHVVVVHWKWSTRLLSGFCSRKRAQIGQIFAPYAQNACEGSSRKCNTALTTTEQHQKWNECVSVHLLQTSCTKWRPLLHKYATWETVPCP